MLELARSPQSIRGEVILQDESPAVQLPVQRECEHIENGHQQSSSTFLQEIRLINAPGASRGEKAAPAPSPAHGVAPPPRLLLVALRTGCARVARKVLGVSKDLSRKRASCQGQASEAGPRSGESTGRTLLRTEDTETRRQDPGFKTRSGGSCGRVSSGVHRGAKCAPWWKGVV